MHSSQPNKDSFFAQPIEREYIEKQRKIAEIYKVTIGGVLLRLQDGNETLALNPTIKDYAEALLNPEIKNKQAKIIFLALSLEMDHATQDIIKQHTLENSAVAEDSKLTFDQMDKLMKPKCFGKILEAISKVLAAESLSIEDKDQLNMLYPETLKEKMQSRNKQFEIFELVDPFYALCKKYPSIKKAAKDCLHDYLVPIYCAAFQMSKPMTHAIVDHKMT